MISRLRDRPPKYETQHNYDTRIQREEAEIEHTDVNTTVDVNNLSQTISASTTEHHAPPAYDGSRESVLY